MAKETKGHGEEKKIKVTRPRGRLYETLTEEKTEGAKKAAAHEEKAIMTIAEEKATAEEATEETAQTSEKGFAAMDVVKNHVIYTMGVAAAPVPFLDIAVVSGMTFKMIRDISKIYGVDMSEDFGRRMIATVLGGSGPLLTAGLASGALMSVSPILGAGFGVTTRPVLAGATLYTIGKYFIRHYEGGGTMENLSFSGMREYLKEKWSEGKEAVKGWRK